ncbi:hypothetical protein C8F01DRAFT_1083495 [Mycena amicta]|nr:hypothetical protein C8F01DRAFT_1083495 [Mycena amicta]
MSSATAAVAPVLDFHGTATPATTPPNEPRSTAKRRLVGESHRSFEAILEPQNTPGSSKPVRGRKKKDPNAPTTTRAKKPPTATAADIQGLEGRLTERVASGEVHAAARMRRLETKLDALVGLFSGGDVSHQLEQEEGEDLLAH